MKLIPVDLSKRERCEHPDIKPKKWYLARCDDGALCAGRFYRVWYGWNLDARYDAGVQLDWITELWEIVS